MSDTQTISKLTPAYVPFDTFEGFLDTLKQVTVPSHVDRVHMTKMSGALQTHLLSSLKFLGLLSADNETKETLHQLVDARGDPAKWKPALTSVIEPAYATIIGDLNLKAGIAKKLREKFKENTTVDGTTLDKAIRFYLKALKSAGVDYSPHFHVRRQNVRRESAGKPVKQEGAQAEATKASKPGNGTTAHESPPLGTISFPLHFPEKTPGSIVVPDDLNEADLEMVNAAVAYIKAYVKARPSKN